MCQFEKETALRIKEVTSIRMHYGYRRVHVLKRHEGHPDNVKRVYRHSRDAGQSLRLKRSKKNKAAQLRPQISHWRPNRKSCPATATH